MFFSIKTCLICLTYTSLPVPKPLRSRSDGCDLCVNSDWRVRMPPPLQRLAQATYALAARAGFVTSRAQAILVPPPAVAGQLWGRRSCAAGRAAAPYLSSRAQTATRQTSTPPSMIETYKSILWGGTSVSSWQFISCLSSCKRLGSSSCRKAAALSLLVRKSPR